jgi:hypothetical protein
MSSDPSAESGQAGGASGEHTGADVAPLDLLDRAAVRKRARSVAIGAVIVAAALGGVVGLLGGRIAGVLTAVVVGLPLVLLAWGESRRTVWLSGATVAVRAYRTRRVDLREANRIELLITQARGTRTLGLLVAGPPRNKTVNISLASYAGTHGNELDILALRKLANALASSANSSGLVYSELLVAQLRAEARGEGAEGRPLYQVVAAAPGGRLAQRVGQEAIVRFVSGLE